MLGHDSISSNPISAVGIRVEITFRPVYRPAVFQGRQWPGILDSSRVTLRVPPVLDRIPEEITPHRSRWLLPPEEYYHVEPKVVRTRIRKPAPKLWKKNLGAAFAKRLIVNEQQPRREDKETSYPARLNESLQQPARVNAETETYRKRVEGTQVEPKRMEE